MTEYVWVKNEDSGIHWLRPQRDYLGLAVGLVHRMNTSDRQRDDWYVATWMPKEKQIAILPKDLPKDEALSMAKMLILLA